MHFYLITVSDSRSKDGDCNDTAGTAVAEILQNNFDTILISRIIVKDDIVTITQQLRLALDTNCNVILTVGGTGISPRDVTPDATKNVIEKELPGLQHLIFSKSLHIRKFSALSRLICGVAKKSLIINLPGSELAATECLSIVLDIIPHAIDLLKDRKHHIKALHESFKKSSSISGSLLSNVITNVTQRERESIYPMITISKAILKIQNVVRCLDKLQSIVSLSDAVDRYSSENIFTHIMYPKFRASTKDGYAVCDTAVGSSKNGHFQVIGVNTPGSSSNECVRVSTGAPVPQNTTVIIPVEYTKCVQSDLTEDEEIIEIKIDEISETNIREIGSDFKEHELIVKENGLITPTIIGLLATNCYNEIKVNRKPIIGIMSTGNELDDNFQKKMKSNLLDLYRIPDSNRLILKALLKRFNYNDILDFGITRDSPHQLLENLTKRLKRCDVVITTGGVSMGEQDYLKSVLIKDFKAEIHFGRLLMKPGKPTTFATCKYANKDKVFFCLPGNPLSAFVTFHLLVLPFLKEFEGVLDFKLPKIRARMKSKVIGDKYRVEYHCVTVTTNGDGGFNAESMGSQSSSKLIHSTSTNGLLIVPIGTILQVNSFGEVYLIDTVLHI